jgi:integration host factor subunit alpha
VTGKTILIIRRILIDNTATYQYRNIVNRFTNLMEGGLMSGTLTKANIITAIQTENGYSLNKSKNIVKTLLEIIKSTMESGEDVLVSGFGKFCVKDKRERKGRNPDTGEDLILAPRKVVTFKCSGKLRDKVNGG